MLFPITNNKSYKKYYLSWVIKQEQFYSLQNELTNIFNKNDIKHIYFKGAVLSKLYDDQSVRTRGDIDVYVNSSDINKAKKLMLENGFTKDDNIKDNTHHYGFRKNNLEVELHFNMFDPDVPASWRKLYSTPFDLCDNVNESLFEFIPTYHILYCIMHFAHHLRHGAGLRYMLDFYYIFKKKDVEFEQLRKELENTKLMILYKNIVNAQR